MAKSNGKRYRVLAVQLNRYTRDTMTERRVEDREVEYLVQGDIRDDFTQAEVDRYTAGTHPGIVEVDEDGLPVREVPLPVMPQPTVPVTPGLVPTDRDAFATDLGDDIDAVAARQETDGPRLDPSADAGRLVGDGQPVPDDTPPAGPPEQRPTDTKPAKAAAKKVAPTKAAAKTVTRGEVAGGNIGAADVQDDDAPQF